MKAEARRLTATAGVALFLLAACIGRQPTAPPSPSWTVPPQPTGTCVPAGQPLPPTVTLLDANGNEVAGRPGGPPPCGPDGSPMTMGPAPQVQLPPDEINIIITVSDGTTFTHWLAYYNSADPNAPPGAVRLSEGSSDAGVSTISFAGPPEGGTFSLTVLLRFPGAVSGGSYWWEIIG